VRRQREALTRFECPVLSLTLVTPGPVKDGPTPRALMEAALQTLEALFRTHAWPVSHLELHLQATGPEAILAVETGALALKRAASGLEDAHPLGRLWDLDVIDPAQGSLSRRELGLPPRRCLLCGAEAHACARSRAHPLPALLAAIEERLRAYRRAR